jgi:hypothetical protein
MQCPNGHTLCSNCKQRVHNRCPTCRYELGNIRCLALEKVAESLELPCRYQSLGCPDIFPYYSKLKHEAQCTYRPYNCPYAGSECSVTGDIAWLVAHLRDEHKVDMHNGCTFNHRYVKSNPQEVENATWMLTVSIPNWILDLIMESPWKISSDSLNVRVSFSCPVIKLFQSFKTEQVFFNSYVDSHSFSNCLSKKMR